jgi:hypothetical protein
MMHSARPSKPPAVFGMQRVVFEGDGEWNPLHGHTTVPAATQVTLYTGTGCAIDDDIGVRIAARQGLPSTIPDDGLDADGDVDTTLGGGYTGRSGHRRTYYGGDRLPNYTLSPPDGLNVTPGSVTVAHDTLLSDLMRIYQGYDCHWAACTVEV